MTVSSQTNTETFDGNGVTTVWDLPFRFFSNTDIFVYLVDPIAQTATPLVLGTDYSLTGAGLPEQFGTAPGKITTTVAVAGGKQLKVVRVMEPEQLTDIVNQGRFFPEVHEDVFDRLMMLIQQAITGLGNALQLDTPGISWDFKGRKGINAANPTQPQDVATMIWAQQYIGGLIGTGQGPVNSAANVLFTGPDGLVYTLQDLSSFADTLKGASLTGFKRKALTKKTITVNEALSGSSTNIWEYADLCVGYVPGGSPNTWDWRPAIQAAVNECPDLYFPAISVPYRVNGEILLNSNNCITMSAGVQIQQLTASTTTFKAILKDNVWLFCNGALILGQGAWSDSWTGMGNSDDRAIQFWGCTRSGAVLPRTRNCASAGIAVFGGSNILIDRPVIEGTHLYGAPIPALGNFQAGVYIRDYTPEYGICDNLIIVAPDISGVAQGVLSELYSAASVVSRAHQIIGANIHDIPGQHAFYIQGGVLAVSNPVLTNINLAGFKVQSGDSNAAIRSFSATGVTADGIGSNLFEMNCTGSGSVNGVILSGTVNGCAVGLACNGQIRDLQCDLIVTNATSNAVLIQGNGPKDMDIRVIGQGIGDDGVLVTATNATGIRIAPRIRECNQNSNATASGLLLQSASAEVQLLDPEFTDVTGKMTYGIFHSTAGSTLKLRGSINISGATNVGIRATGKITEMPNEQNVSGALGQYIGIENITSSGKIRTTIRTGSASSVSIWSYTLPDESAVTVKVRVTGKLLGSTERRSYEAICCVYRDGGGVATLQGAVTVLSNIASAGFTGVIILGVTGGNGVTVAVNSGGVATYDWVAEAEVLQAL